MATQVMTREGHVPTRTVWTRMFTLARQRPLGAVALVLLVIVTLASIFSSVIVPYDPTQVVQSERLQPPSWRHLAGTDQFGRDVLARTLAAGRVSLTVGLMSALLGGLGGLLLGGITAYYGGWVDRIVQSIVDALIAIPSLIMLLGVVSVFSPGIFPIVGSLAFRSAVNGSRTLRAAALSIKQEPYLEASHALGTRPLRIIGLHMLPNMFAPAVTVATLSIGGAILSEASLSFLGYGIPPPSPTWGGMLSREARPYLIDAPWMMIAPSLALGITVYSINMFGDALRDTLDPRLRGR